MITDLNDFRLEKAIEVGIDIVCNVGKSNFVETVKESFGDEWFDVAFEAAGIKASLDDAVQNIQKGDDIVVLGVFGDRPRVDISVVGDRELGRLQEARAEVSKLLEKNPHYTLKSLNHQPYKDRNRRERLINDLRKAGVPE
jgi:threonine dehydrogenase-like Zn-dependent dehydrogenase